EKFRTRFRLECLREEAALEAVTGPLQGTGRFFAKDAAEKLVQELMKISVPTAAGKVVEVPGEFIEPMHLQLVCQRLWQSLSSDITEIKSEDVEVSGDIDKVLSKFYESAIKKAVKETNVKEGELRRWFERMLITPAGTRGMVYKAEKTTGGVPNETIEVLEELHLVRGEWRGRAQWYELTHDRFIEPIRK